MQPPPASPQNKWTGDFLDERRKMGDPAADNAISAIVGALGQKESMRIFDLLIRQIEVPAETLPKEVQTFLNVCSVLPDWADPQKIRKASSFFLDHGPAIFLILYFKSLPTLYACKEGAEVLVMTGRLAKDRENREKFTRRIAETAQFMIDVLSPGGLTPEGQGMKTIQRVRLIHGAIRHFVSRAPGAPPNPINQEELAITLMSFSATVLQGLNQWGIAISDEEAESYLHAWKVTGFLLGIREDLLPESVFEAHQLLDTILARHAAPSEAGKLLTAALIDFSQEVIPRTAFDATPSIILRYLNGDQMAELLGVPQASGCLTSVIPYVIRKFLGWSEKLEDHSLGARLVLDKLSKALIQAMAGYFDKYKEKKFRYSPEMEKKWGLSKE